VCGGQAIGVWVAGVTTADEEGMPMWEVGDGTTGSGPALTHTYARPGTYTVTAVLFSGVGSAFPGQGAGAIYQQKITVG
jgi:hypothetical protein